MSSESVVANSNWVELLMASCMCVCVVVLQQNGTSAVDQCSASTATDHLLTESSVALGQICRVCGRVLLGLVRQGFLCHSTYTHLPPSYCLLQFVCRVTVLW